MRPVVTRSGPSAVSILDKECNMCHIFSIAVLFTAVARSEKVVFVI